MMLKYKARMISHSGFNVLGPPGLPGMASLPGMILFGGFYLEIVFPDVSPEPFGQLHASDGSPFLFLEHFGQGCVQLDGSACCHFSSPFVECFLGEP
jgi:hypothetical protein